MAARLVTIPFSHYCEKARWALEACGVEYREEGHLPLFHVMPVKLAGGGRTVPLLVDGRTVVADSTPIIAWADAKRPGTLLPADERDREEALQLEDELDRLFQDPAACVELSATLDHHAGAVPSASTR